MFLLFIPLVLDARPKIGLVLSGGGARGSAHIGVIEELEALQVPVDFIVGTSIGAVIGGLYASGVPIAVIKRNLTSLGWEVLFRADTKRGDLYYRRKEDFEIFQIKSFIRFVNGRTQLSLGLINGQNIYEYFKSAFLPLEPLPDFNHLQIPFKAVATDLLSGSAFILEEGDLALALLASMAVPGVISPVTVGNYLLVDGGVSHNLPISIAKEMGADILIVVDVSTPPYRKEEIGGLVTVLDQLTTVFTNYNVMQNKKLLTEKDILIQPVLGNMETTDFDQFKKGILKGEEAAQAAREALEKYAMPHEKKRPFPSDRIKIDKVIVDNQNLPQETYEHYLRFDLNQPVPIATINKKIDMLYGLSIFDAIYYGIEKKDTEAVLVVRPEIKPPKAVYLQGGLFLESDFEDTNDFSFVLGITNPQVNTWLGEWRLLGRVGKGVGVLAEFYQPLSPTLTWFVNPYVSFQRDVLNLYFDYEQIATYLASQGRVGVALGRNFSNWGRLKGSFEWEKGSFYKKEGSSVLSRRHPYQGKMALVLEWDTIDNLYFPRHGTKGSAKIVSDSKIWGGQSNFSQFQSRTLIGNAMGKHALVLSGLYNATLKGEPDIQYKFFLGGLFRLSGLARDELYGNNAFLASAIYFYEIKKMNLLNKLFPVYVGGSLEGGNVIGAKNLTSTRSVIGAMSLFVGADTIAGPLYLAGGQTATGRRAVSLMLRPTFN